MFLKNLAALIKVKTMITFVVLFVFAYLAMIGRISAEDVEKMAYMVLSFYFCTQIEKKTKEE